MAWTTPITAVSNAPFTAAQYNASDRDNMLLTPAALATGAGQMWISTAANAGAMRTPAYAHTTGTGTTTAIGTWSDLTGTTVGPAVTATTGIAAIVSIGSYLGNGTGGGNACMSYAVSGATTLPGDNARLLRAESSSAGATYRMSYTGFLPSLTAGSNTFTAKYTTGNGGTATYSERHLMVIPL